MRIMRGSKTPHEFIANAELPLDQLTLYTSLTNAIDDAHEEQRRRKKKDLPATPEHERIDPDMAARLMTGYRRRDDPDFEGFSSTFDDENE